MGNNQDIWWSSFDGAGWAPQQTIAGVASSLGPTIAPFGNTLAAVWKGMNNDQHLRWSHFDATAGLRKARFLEIPGQTRRSVGSRSGPLEVPTDASRKTIAIVEPERIELTAEAGKPIELPLPRGAANGISWRLLLPVGVTIAPINVSKRLDESQAGEPAAGHAAAVCASLGTHEIEARLVRPWLPQAPIRTILIQLTAT